MAKLSICLGLTISLILNLQLSNSFDYVNYRCELSDNFDVRYVVPDVYYFHFFVKDRVIRISIIDFGINGVIREDVKEDGIPYFLAYRQPETARYDLMEKRPNFANISSTKVIYYEVGGGTLLNSKVYALESGASQAYEVLFDSRTAG